MSLLIKLFFISILITSQSVTAYEVINRDYKLPPEQVRIDFSPSVHKKEATLNIKTCHSCPWEDYKINQLTDMYKTTIPVDYITFKQKVKNDLINPPSRNYTIYLSVNIKTKEVFTIKWDYLEL